jgi:hypothetical protein
MPINAGGLALFVVAIVVLVALGFWLSGYGNCC